MEDEQTIDKSTVQDEPEQSTNKLEIENSNLTYDDITDIKELNCDLQEYLHHSIDIKDESELLKPPQPYHEIVLDQDRSQLICKVSLSRLESSNLTYEEITDMKDESEPLERPQPYQEIVLDQDRSHLICKVSLSRLESSNLTYEDIIDIKDLNCDLQEYLHHSIDIKDESEPLEPPQPHQEIVLDQDRSQLICKVSLSRLESTNLTYEDIIDIKDLNCNLQEYLHHSIDIKDENEPLEPPQLHQEIVLDQDKSQLICKVSLSSLESSNLTYEEISDIKDESEPLERPQPYQEQGFSCDEIGTQEIILDQDRSQLICKVSLSRLESTILTYEKITDIKDLNCDLQEYLHHSIDIKDESEPLDRPQPYQEQGFRSDEIGTQEIVLNQDRSQLICKVSLSRLESSNLTCEEITDIKDESEPLERSQPYQEQGFSCDEIGTQEIVLDQDRSQLICKVSLSRLPSRLASPSRSKPPSKKNIFFCKRCKYEAARKSDLKVHLKTHPVVRKKECSFCHSKFSCNSKLNLHLRTHTGDKPYACDTCRLKFASKSNLQRHLKIHTGKNKPYKCRICKVTLSSKSYLRIHFRLHTGERPFECKFCDLTFLYKSSLRVHLNVHSDTGEKPYTCDTCQLKLSSKTTLIRHLRIHTRKKKYTCETCQLKFSTKSNLRNHFLQVHFGQRPCTCEICDLKFTNKSQLAIHSRVHTGIKPYSCKFCHSKFRHLGTLKYHLGKRRYQCAVCNTKFKTKWDLSAHLRSHSGEKRFACEVCPSKFSKSTDLRNHSRIHSGEKPYTCGKCNFKFSIKSNLRSHMRRHTSGKPYKCEVCDKKFKYKINLQRHLKTHK